jgi:hypothetical protein
MNRQPEFKVAVALLKQYCKEHQIEINHSHILELVAIDRGYPSYNVYRAQEKTLKKNNSAHQAITEKIVSAPTQTQEVTIAHIPQSDRALPQSNGDFINVQDVHTPIQQPDEGTQNMYASMDNPRKDKKIPQTLPTLAPRQVNNKNELFTALLKDFHWGRINGIAGEMHVNKENLKKLIGGKADFEDEIIHFAYPHPYPQTLEKYRPGEVSIIAHVMENIIYLNYGQWFIPGVGCVNFNNWSSELTGTPLKARWIDTGSTTIKGNPETTYNVFANGLLVLPEIDIFYEAMHKADGIAEDDIFGGFAEVRDAQNDELVYYHAYGFQMPVYTQDHVSKVILQTEKKEVIFPALSTEVSKNLIEAVHRHAPAKKASKKKKGL